MKRKVIQIAGSTQLISLPRKWALKYNIQKGEELEITEQGNSIYVTTSKDSTMEKATLTLKSANKFLRRSIDVLYRYGYDEIEVKFEDPRIVELIQSALDELLGFEIVSQGGNYCILKNIASGVEVEFDNILRRLFLMIISMHNDSFEAIKKKDFQNLKKIQQQDKIVNKFTNFCERMLNKRGFKDYKKTTLIYYIVCVLEELADEYKDLCNYIIDKDKMDLSKESLKIYSQVGDIFERFYKLFYHFEREKLFELKQQRMITQEKIIEILEKKQGPELIIIKHLSNIVSKIQHMATRII